MMNFPIFQPTQAGFYPNQYYPNYNMIERHMLSMHDPAAREIYPYVNNVIDRNDNPWINPMPSQRDLDRMTDEVIRSYEYHNSGSQEVDTQQFGGQRFFRGLVVALLISELLRRRRRIYSPYY